MSLDFAFIMEMWVGRAFMQAQKSAQKHRPGDVVVLWVWVISDVFTLIHCHVNRHVLAADTFHFLNGHVIQNVFLIILNQTQKTVPPVFEGVTFWGRPVLIFFHCFQCFPCAKKWMFLKNVNGAALLCGITAMEWSGYELPDWHQPALWLSHSLFQPLGGRVASSWQLPYKACNLD